MKINKWIIVLIILFISSAYSCKKYEEGPMLSLRSKTERVSNEWVLQETLLDGDIVTFANHINYYEYKKDGEYILHSTTWNIVGSWEFYDSKKYIIRSYPDFEHGGAAFSGKTDTVRILKLKENEFWVFKDLANGVLEEHYISK